MPRKTAKKITSLAKLACSTVVSKASGQLEVLIPLLIPPLRLGVMLSDQKGVGYGVKLIMRRIASIETSHGRAHKCSLWAR